MEGQRSTISTAQLLSTGQVRLWPLAPFAQKTMKSLLSEHTKHCYHLLSPFPCPGTAQCLATSLDSSGQYGRRLSHCSHARQRVPMQTRPQESGCPEDQAGETRLPPVRSPCWFRPHPKPFRCQLAVCVRYTGRASCLETGSSWILAGGTPRYLLLPLGSWTKPDWHNCGSRPRTCRRGTRVRTKPDFHIRSIG